MNISTFARRAGLSPSGVRWYEAAGTEATGTEAAGTEAAGTEAAGTEAAGTDAAGTEPAATEAEGVTEGLRPGASNRLTVVVERAPDEQGQTGWTSRVRHWKARFAYGWDWCTRLVPVGLIAHPSFQAKSVSEGMKSNPLLNR